MTMLNRSRDVSLRLPVVLAAAIVLALAGLAPAAIQAKKDGDSDAKMKERVHKMQEMAPARGYLEAHKRVDEPFDLLGGPLQVAVSQTVGGVHVALPDHRKLDPRVFGTPDHPRAFAGTPGINGVPVPLREVQGGEFTQFKKLSPFGDKAVVMAEGRLHIEATDATATDAATSDDQVEFKASWKDEEGNTYEVRCCAKLATHGLEYPTFGGVVTNHMLHGFTRIGTALMPSEYAYFAFWGMGEVLKNGEVQAKPRLIHGMLTEYVRHDGYQLAFDHQVTPEKRHFHLMVPPMMPDMEKGVFQHVALPTGFTLPNGKELPFWHVMFGNLEIQGEREP